MSRLSLTTEQRQELKRLRDTATCAVGEDGQACCTRTLRYQQQRHTDDRHTSIR